MAVQDYLKGEIQLWWLVFLASFRHLWPYGLLLVLVLVYPLLAKWIGGADLWVLTLLLTRYSLYQVSLMLLVSSALGILWCLLLHKKSLRFLPFLFLAAVFVHVFC
ncbi:MAG: hypothetical protein LBR25_07950 [Erysipelotrichaceae bacterium]|nr:hypothetical protein [Erysipelotrichaceae bacterium]